MNEERVEYSRGKKLDLISLLNRIGSFFNSIEKETSEYGSLQAALTAQVRKNEYKGTQGNARNQVKIQCPNIQNVWCEAH